MRYSYDENAVLVGPFEETGLTVKMIMIVLENDSKVELIKDDCLESKHISGVYLYSTENIKPNILVDKCNILCVMYDVNDVKKRRYSKISFDKTINQIIVEDLSSIKASIVSLTDKVDELVAEVL